jgi:hypothetical protein
VADLRPQNGRRTHQGNRDENDRPVSDLRSWIARDHSVSLREDSRRLDDCAESADPSSPAQSPADGDYLASIKAATEKGLFDIGSIETAIWRTL